VLWNAPGFGGFDSDSHVFMERAEPFASVTVPLHRELHTRTLRSIIRIADMTVEAFRDLL
jgi:HicA toxin of bacterial toxin-antitoxin,